MRDARAWAPPPVEPLFDTWGPKTSAGYWCVTPSPDSASPSAREINARIETSMTDTLNACSNLMRAWQIGFGTIAEQGAAPVALEWDLKEPYATFLDTARRAIREYPAPIYSVEVLVDVFAYFRTPRSPEQPVRAWARLHDQFRIWGGPGAEDRCLCFNLGHTLFRPSSQDGVDNTRLYLLNHPLLETALRRWEERVGPITEFDGLSGIYAYGFRPEGGVVERGR